MASLWATVSYTCKHAVRQHTALRRRETVTESESVVRRKTEIGATAVICVNVRMACASPHTTRKRPPCVLCRLYCTTLQSNGNGHCGRVSAGY